MKVSEQLFLKLIRVTVHGGSLGVGRVDRQTWNEIVSLANKHSILPLIIQAAWESKELNDYSKSMIRYAERLTTRQAQRTADFLCFCRYLSERGLKPIVIKGIICRSLYPNPEQRSSVDEDLLIRPDDIYQYHQAMLDYGMEPTVSDADLEEADELSYIHRDYGLYIEIHKKLFPKESVAYGELNRYFDGILRKKWAVTEEDQEILTLPPTDHLLYMLFHAFKHFLHGGVGIRHVCDIGLFADINYEKIDWKYILKCCKEVNLDIFSGTLFSISGKYLGFGIPETFRAYAIDEGALLEDILSGGLYGTSDINRAHSAEITLGAVSAAKARKRKPSVLHTVFLPLRKMKGKYPVLSTQPWLLPVAWVDRVVRYMISKDNRQKVRPLESIRIGRSRVELLRKYGVI